MMKKRTWLAGLLSLMVWLLPSISYAQTAELAPAVGIPNDNGTSSLQNTGSGLQPNTDSSTSQSPSNLTQLLLDAQPGGQLRVEGTNTPEVNVQGVTTTSTSSSTTVSTPKAGTNSLFWIAAGLLALGFLSVCMWQFMKPFYR
jgi:hypothetical protein